MNDELALFPAIFRPRARYSYNHTGQNIISNPVAGGSSRQTLNYCQEKVPINVNFTIGSQIEMQILNDWYFNIVCQGTRKFQISLNLTGGFEDFVCLIVPGSFSVTTERPFEVSMTLEAEKITAPFDGQLYSLAQDGYSNISAYFARIETFANFDLL